MVLLNRFNMVPPPPALNSGYSWQVDWVAGGIFAVQYRIFSYIFLLRPSIN